MSDIVKHTIDVTPIGLDKLSQVPAIVHKVSDAVSKVKPPLDPLNKIVQILSRIDKVLSEIGKVGVASFSKLNDVWATNHKGFSKMNESASKLEKQIEKIGATSRKSGKDVEEGFLAKFNKVGIAVQSVKNIASLASGILSPIFEEGMARQNALSDFETLIGKEDAKDYADKLRNSSAATLYGASAINENAKSMLAYGVDKDTVMQMQDVLGDIAMGDKNKMTSLATAFSQMSSLGKLQTQDWKQMVGAGFNPFTQMQKDLGKTAEELDTMMQKGQITADMVKDAFVNATKEGGQFFGSMAGTMEGTLGGKIAVMKSKFDDLKAKLFDLALPIAEKIVPLVTEKVFPLIEKMTPLVEKLMPVLDGVIWLLSKLADYITENWEAISELAVGFGVIYGAIMLVTSPVTWIILAIGALTAGLVWLVNNWEEWHDTVVRICFPLAVLIDVIKSVKKHWDSIVDGFKSGGVLEGIKRIGLAILDGILRPVQSLLEMLSKIEFLGIGSLAEWAKGGVDNLRNKINNALPEPEKDAESEGNVGTESDLEQYVNGRFKSGGGVVGNQLASVTGKGAEAVASGGTRNTQITITLGNMVDTVNFNGTPSDNAQETVDMFTTLLLRALYSAQTAV